MRELKTKFLLTIVTLLVGLFLPGSLQIAVAENLELHEAVNVQGSGHSNSCVAPATYSYDDTFGIVDCKPIERGSCDYVTVCYYRRTKGCFPPEAKIQMSDGSQKTILDLRSGDKVWNPVLKKASTVGRLTSGSEETPLLEFGYGDVRVRVTEKHPMVVRGADGQAVAKPALEVQADEALLGADGAFHKLEVLKVLPVQAGQQVYNFEITSDSSDQNERMIAADGVVTGDVVVQSRLNGDKLPWER